MSLYTYACVFMWVPAYGGQRLASKNSLEYIPLTLSLLAHLDWPAINPPESCCFPSAGHKWVPPCSAVLHGYKEIKLGSSWVHGKSFSVCVKFPNHSKTSFHYVPVNVEFKMSFFQYIK